MNILNAAAFAHRRPSRRTTRAHPGWPVLLVVSATLLVACDRDASPVDPIRAPAAVSDQRPSDRGKLFPVTTFATGLNNPRGLRFGPDRSLYVAEAGAGGSTSTAGTCTQVMAPVGPYTGGNTARITKINSAGVKSVVVDGLPSSVNAMGFVNGIVDLEFIRSHLYALVDGAGCSHGHADVPNGIVRINSDRSVTRIADLSAFYKSHPTARPEPGDFEPDGVPYSMVAVDDALYVVEANHGSLDRVDLDGSVHRVADISATFGHIVPTSVTHLGVFFIANLNPFPVVPGSSQVIAVAPHGAMATVLHGVTAVLGSAWDRWGRYYVLETTTAPGGPTPGTGRVRRFSAWGGVITIADSLFFPTGMTIGPDGDLYISNVGFGPPPVGLGTILRVKLDGL
ncbi:MAG: ScyD/ScyE family protein [bacterium]